LILIKCSLITSGGTYNKRVRWKQIFDSRYKGDQSPELPRSSHANQQQISRLVNIIVGLPQSLFHPFPRESHVSEGGHKDRTGHWLSRLPNRLTSPLSDTLSLRTPKLIQTHLPAPSSRGHMKPCSCSEKLLFHCLSLLGPLDLYGGPKQARPWVRGTGGQW